MRKKLIPRIIQCALRDEPVPIYGDGRNVRDWVAVEDHCRAVDLVLRQGIPGEIYNVGAGCELENLTLAKRILELLGRPETLIRLVADRPGHDRRYAVCADKLRALGWEPQIPFERGLAKTVAWYCEQAEWNQDAVCF